MKERELIIFSFKNNYLIKKYLENNYIEYNNLEKKIM